MLSSWPESFSGLVGACLVAACASASARACLAAFSASRDCFSCPSRLRIRSLRPEISPSGVPSLPAATTASSKEHKACSRPGWTALGLAEAVLDTAPRPFTRRPSSISEALMRVAALSAAVAIALSPEAAASNLRCSSAICCWSSSARACSLSARSRSELALCCSASARSRSAETRFRSMADTFFSSATAACDSCRALFSSSACFALDCTASNSARSWLSSAEWFPCWDSLGKTSKTMASSSSSCAGVPCSFEETIPCNRFKSLPTPCLRIRLLSVTSRSLKSSRLLPSSFIRSSKFSSIRFLLVCRMQSSRNSFNSPSTYCGGSYQ
mmetsp:Transcript_111669/g.360483  ORF Transcript_111669/g.360483 Transcript_111669/m.360483 type:complete len:327 (+) Transcript_111669:2112-3092(+)